MLLKVTVQFNNITQESKENICHREFVDLTFDVKKKHDTAIFMKITSTNTYVPYEVILP